MGMTVSRRCNWDELPSEILYNIFTRVMRSTPCYRAPFWTLYNTCSNWRAALLNNCRCICLHGTIVSSSIVERCTSLRSISGGMVLFPDCVALAAYIVGGSPVVGLKLVAPNCTIHRGKRRYHIPDGPTEERPPPVSIFNYCEPDGKKISRLTLEQYHMPGIRGPIFVALKGGNLVTNLPDPHAIIAVFNRYQIRRAVYCSQPGECADWIDCYPPLHRMKITSDWLGSLTFHVDVIMGLVHTTTN